MNATQDVGNIRRQEVARLQAHLLQEILDNGNVQIARERLFDILGKLSDSSSSSEGGGLFVSVALKASDLCFVWGHSFREMFPYLVEALKAAARLGDRRSQALIKLHLARLHYLSDRRLEAMSTFVEGKAEVEALGDEDILTQAGEFLGLFFFMQGLFREAQSHFERAAASYETQEKGRLVNPSAAMWMSYCDAYLGLFHRAIGRLNHHRHLALARSDQSLATTLSAVMGIVLLTKNEAGEAEPILLQASKGAAGDNNALALYFSRAALAYLRLHQGNPGLARDLLAQGLADASGCGIVLQYASPFVLEMIHEFHRLRLEPIPRFSFQEEAERIFVEPNIHLKGVVLRLRSITAMNSGGDLRKVQDDLEVSEELLIRCGDPIQLGKTRLEMARLKLRERHYTQAGLFAQEAWTDLVGHGEGFFPDDLRHIIGQRHVTSRNSDSREEFLSGFIQIVEELLLTQDPDRLLSRAVAAINNFLGAERGGLFCFRRRDEGKKPIVRALCNLTSSEVFSRDFGASMGLISKAFREMEPQIVHVPNPAPHKVRSILCIPFDMDDRTQGVLYHDNSYLDDRFDILDKDLLKRMADYMSRFVNQMWKFSRHLEEAAFSATESTVHRRRLGSLEFLTRSPTVSAILDQADRIADSDGTVLILGETGVGKELLAQRLHTTSGRRDGPFVIVDLSTIPDNLVESELFGHEKGAFTGADSRTIGRLEVAHRGTLFLDEVGEIPKHIQTKLLRILQDKTLVRVGGTQPISTDFRLITATNRDLAEEVAAGRFREDLYYRLNVLPLVLPPLRERREDIPLLARYFLDLYSSKHGRRSLRLVPRDEARLVHYDWPGNVRELKNVIERAVLLSTEDALDLDPPSQKAASKSGLVADDPTLDELQRRYIRLILQKTGGRLSGPRGAAEILGMKRSSLYNRMKRLGLR